MDGVVESIRTALATVRFFALEGVRSVRENWGIGLLALVLAGALWIFVTDRENPDVTGRVPGTVPVEVVNVPQNQAVASLSQDVVVVRVTAPEDVFNRLTAEDFSATLDLSGVTGQSASVEVTVESEERRVEIVEVTPARLAVELEDITSAVVPIRANILSAPPRGFEVGEITVQPEEAVVTGPERITELNLVAEADVNLTGITTDFEQTLVLQVRDAQGVQIAGVEVTPDTVLVQIELVQVQFSQLFVVVPEVTGTPAQGFRVTGIEIDPPLVTISGPVEVFQTLDPTEGVATEPVVIDGAMADVVRPVALRLPEDASVTQATVTVRVTIERVATEEP